jgi:hypothetical protein
MPLALESIEYSIKRKLQSDSIGGSFGAIESDDAERNLGESLINTSSAPNAGQLFNCSMAHIP